MPSVLPEEIVYEAEREHVDPDLDFLYIDGLAQDLAGLLAAKAVAECVYQPGDGTRYPLVFVPLLALRHGRGLELEGREWEHHAVGGMKANSAEAVPDDAPGSRWYDPAGYLICWVDHADYPLRLGGRGHKSLAGDYVGDKWKTTAVSAVSLALLFRAISIHLDRISDAGRLHVVQS